MKNFKKLAIVALCAIIGVGNAFAQNDAERMAMRNMKDYLQSKGISSKIDNSDNSLNFLSKDVLYWITFNGNATSMLFTLHRAPIKMINDNVKQRRDYPEYRNRLMENATRAAEFVTANNPYKAFVKGDKVEFEFPVFASSTAEYQRVFDRVLSSMRNAKESFDANYKRAKHFNDSIHQYWQKNDTSKIIVTQQEKQRIESGKNLKITSVAFHSIDKNDNEISKYDEGLRKSKTQYIQPKIELVSDKKGTFKVGVKIFTPEGKLLVPTAVSDFTTITTIDVEKANKPLNFELLKFGKEGDGLWKAGEYTVKIYEDDRLLTKDSFTIL